MFARTTIVALLAFVLLANTLPLKHGRRGACRPHSSITVSSAVPVPTGNNNAGGQAPPVKDATTTVKNQPTNSVKGSASTSKPTKPSSTPAPAPGSGGNTLLNALFPVSGASKSWSTAPNVPGHIPLSENALGAKNILSALSRDVVAAPDGKQAMKAHYPKGSYSLHNALKGGFSFYASGPKNVDLTTAKEATLGYSVFFPKGFGFQLGGKLPGLYGGNSDEEAVNCSGGRRSTKCVSARLMWRANGAGELYTYLPPYDQPGFGANKKQCDAIANSDCNPTYGASIGRNSFQFTTGKWVTVAQRVRLNSVGKADGELELFVDGKSVINLTGLILRDSAAGKLRGLQMQTFFGGSKAEFASPKDQDVYFSDFSVAITETL